MWKIRYGISAKKSKKLPFRKLAWFVKASRTDRLKWNVAQFNYFTLLQYYDTF